MANKAISELPQASNVNNQDLFVLEQSGIAKKLTAETFITEQGIIDALAEALDGHGGIQSVTLSSVSGRIRTYLITFTDGSSTTFQVLDGTSISRIEKTSTAGLVDTYTVYMSDGTTSFFQVRNGQDGSATWDQINSKAPIITDTATGTIANFPDGADDIPVTSLVVNIEPKQSGSGVPSPSNIRPISGWTGCNVTRTGRNLFNWDRSLGTPNPTTGSNATSPRVMDVAHYYVGLRPDNYYYPSNITEYNVSNGAITIRATNNSYGVGFPVAVEANTTYTLHGIASANPHLAVGYYDSAWNYLGTYGKTGNKITFTTVASTAYAVVVLQSSSTSVAATWTNVQLELGSTATDYQPYTILTVDWTTVAGTVYGGTVDLTTGVLTVTDGYIASYDGETLPSTWISDRDVYASGTTPTTGAEVVYKLATPLTYQLTGQQLKTFLGTNNVWADTGNVSVTYPADTKMFIEKLTMPTEDDLVANQAITSGEYFMIGNSLYLALANIANGAQITIGTNAQRVSLADALNAINS